MIGQLCPSPSNSLIPQMLIDSLIAVDLSEEMVDAECGQRYGYDAEDDLCLFAHGGYFNE